MYICFVCNERRNENIIAKWLYFHSFVVFFGYFFHLMYLCMDCPLPFIPWHSTLWIVRCKFSLHTLVLWYIFFASCIVVVIFVSNRLGNSVSFAAIFISVSVGVAIWLLLLLFRLTSAAIRKSQFLFLLLLSVDGVVVVFDFQFFIFQQRGRWREQKRERESTSVYETRGGGEKERHVK